MKMFPYVIESTVANSGWILTYLRSYFYNVDQLKLLEDNKQVNQTQLNPPSQSGQNVFTLLRDVVCPTPEEIRTLMQIAELQQEAK